MSEWKSKCCGAEIYNKEKTGYVGPFGFYYCSKCHEPCKTEEKEETEAQIFMKNYLETKEAK